MTLDLYFLFVFNDRQIAHDKHKTVIKFEIWHLKISFVVHTHAFIAKESYNG